MLEGLDHTVQLSLWRHCRIVSNEQIIIVALLVCVPVHVAVPGPVSDLSATPGVVQLTISWTAPSEPNGVITMYQVTHNSTGVLNYTNTSATQLTLRDLPPNTAVEYSVRAYTIIGPGEPVSNIASTMDICECTSSLMQFFYHISLAQISIRVVSVVSVSSTSVRVIWTPLNEPVVDHYTVHYTLVGSGGKRRQVSSGTVTFPASASSGAVSGLQEGQQYQFSVSVSLTVNGQTYTSTPGEPFNALTGKHDLCIAKCLLTLLEIVYLNKVNFKIIAVSINSNVCTTIYQKPLLTSSTVFTTVMPSSFPPSLTSSCLSYSAGLGAVSVIMITSLIGNLVFVIGCVLLRRKYISSPGSKK